MAKLYTYRWHIETFFRWFKCTLGCRHLFAESENGMCLQFYSALIASLLVVIYSNRKPNKRLWERIQFYLMGIATAEEVLVVVEKCKAQVSRDKNQAG